MDINLQDPEHCRSVEDLKSILMLKIKPSAMEKKKTKKTRELLLK